MSQRSKVPAPKPCVGGEAISIVLATFNGERYLRAQLESLERQSLTPLELVIADDKSSDRTVEIIAEFAQTANFPVHYSVNSERLGYTRNFLAAVKSSRGRYIAFCDQDDIWTREKLAVVAAAISGSANPPDLILHTCKLLRGENLDPAPFPPHLQQSGTFPPLQLDPLAIVPGHSIIARRELIDLVSRLHGLLPKEVFVARGHDDLSIFLGTVIGKTEVVAYPLVYWRQHDGNTCGLPKSDWELNPDFQPHLEFLRGHAAQWSSIAQALTALSDDVSGPYQSRLLSGAKFFARRARFFNQRGDVCDTKISLPSRFSALLQAHLSPLNIRGGARRDSVKNLVRDVASVLIGPQRLDRLVNSARAFKA